jgi:hypothetical protein
MRPSQLLLTKTGVRQGATPKFRRVNEAAPGITMAASERILQSVEVYARPRGALGLDRRGDVSSPDVLRLRHCDDIRVARGRLRSLK